VNRAFDEVFRGFPAVSRGAGAIGGFAPNLEQTARHSGQP